MRSTTKPDAACPSADTTKKTVIMAPAWVKLRPNSGISQGNSGGSSRWKKCEVPWAKPTRPMTRTSLRMAAEAAVMAKRPP